MSRSLISGLALAFALASCVHINVGPEDEFFKVDSVVDAYGNVDGLDDWDGSFLDIGLFTNVKGPNEIFQIELGPLFAFGVGLVGTRVRVLPLEFGVGTLFYNARPRKKRVDEPTIEDGIEAPPEPVAPVKPPALEVLPPTKQEIE